MASSNKKRLTRTRFVFSLEQRRKIIQEIESGKITRHEALEKYNIIRMRTLNNWLIEHGTSKESLVRKHYPQEVQRQIAYSIIAGKATKEELSSQLKINPTQLARWVLKFKNDVIQERKKKGIGKNSQSNKNEKKEIEELKLRIAALEMMIDIAERDLKIEIRKKSGTKQ